jgi:putative membrane protein
MSFVQSLGAFAMYFGMAIGFVVVFLLIFLRMTAHAEIALVRAGNTAAAISTAGALLGFCLPLAMALKQAVSPADLAIWATVALLSQLTAYAFVRLLLPGYSKRIEAGEIAASVLAMALHLGVGLLNSAAMVV